MAIDTGSGASAVDPVVAHNLRLIENRIPQGVMYDAEGEQFTYSAVVHSLGIGDMHAADVRVLVWPSPMFEGAQIAGVLGADLLRHFDVDIDFSARKLNLISQDHCPGRVVYWTSGDVAVVPMHVVNSGHIIVPVSLDGHDVDAVLDTGSALSVLSMEFAQRTFGLAPDSPNMTRVGQMHGAAQVPIYRYTFKNIALDGVAIGNPTLMVRDDLAKYSMTQAHHSGSRISDANESGGVTDLTLGLNELRHLHLYIAYKGQKLYITGAAPPAAAAAAASSSIAPTTAAAH